MSRDAKSIGNGQFVCFIDEDGFEVEGKAGDPIIAIRIAEENLRLAQQNQNSQSETQTSTTS